jgi:5-methylcytosine-specific restriction protein A
LDDDFLAEANIDELRKVAILKARGSLPPKKREAIYRAKSAAIRRYVLLRADGRCEGCSAAAPFLGADGEPFLETHHTTRVADEGSDHPRTVIGICPNCHRRAHYAEDAEIFNASLIRKLPKLEEAARKR